MLMMIIVTVRMGVMNLGQLHAPMVSYCAHNYCGVREVEYVIVHYIVCVLLLNCTFTVLY